MSQKSESNTGKALRRQGQLDVLNKSILTLRLDSESLIMGIQQGGDSLTINDRHNLLTKLKEAHIDIETSMLKTQKYFFEHRGQAQ